MLRERFDLTLKQLNLANNWDLTRQVIINSPEGCVAPETETFIEYIFDTLFKLSREQIWEGEFSFEIGPNETFPNGTFVNIIPSTEKRRDTRKSVITFSQGYDNHETHSSIHLKFRMSNGEHELLKIFRGYRGNWNDKQTITALAVGTFLALENNSVFPHPLPKDLWDNN